MASPCISTNLLGLPMGHPPTPPPWTSREHLCCICSDGLLWSNFQEVGFCHMRIGEGVNSRLQLSGLLAKLCKVVIRSQ